MIKYPKKKLKTVISSDKSFHNLVAVCQKDLCVYVAESLQRLKHTKRSGVLVW